MLIRLVISLVSSLPTMLPRQDSKLERYESHVRCPINGATNANQATYICVPLSPSGITWYPSKGSDAVRLGSP